MIIVMIIRVATGHLARQTQQTAANMQQQQQQQKELLTD